MHCPLHARPRRSLPTSHGRQLHPPERRHQTRRNHRQSLRRRLHRLRPAAELPGRSPATTDLRPTDIVDVPPCRVPDVPPCHHGPIARCECCGRRIRRWRRKRRWRRGVRLCPRVAIDGHERWPSSPAVTSRRLPPESTDPSPAAMVMPSLTSGAAAPVRGTRARDLSTSPCARIDPRPARMVTGACEGAEARSSATRDATAPTMPATAPPTLAASPVVPIPHEGQGQQADRGQSPHAYRNEACDPFPCAHAGIIGAAQADGYGGRADRTLSSHPTSQRQAPFK